MKIKTNYIAQFQINSLLNYEIRKKIQSKKTQYKITQAPFVCWKVVFFWKVNSGKMNYFSMFGSVMENKLENTFQCLVMS